MHQEANNTLSRRDMLKISAAGTLAAGIGCGPAIGKDTPLAKPGIALQLYSIRGECGKDFDAALQQVAAMGFDAVEFAGYHKYANDPVGLRKQLDDLGLKVCGTHIGTGMLIGNALAKTIEFHKAIGCKYLIVPGDSRFSKPDGSKELAEIFNTAAEQLKKVDMYTGYHNHTHEFATEGGKTYWELFAERTSEDVVLQQDVGWTTAAGHDPAALIRKYPGRSKIIHCKPTLVKGDPGRPIIGEDSVKWAEIITASMQVGGTEWLTVEQESYLPDTSPMACVQLSLAGLNKILANL